MTSQDTAWQLTLEHQKIAHDVAANAQKRGSIYRLTGTLDDIKQEATLGLYRHFCKQRPDPRDANWPARAARVIWSHLFRAACHSGLVKVSPTTIKRRLNQTDPIWFIPHQLFDFVAERIPEREPNTPEDGWSHEIQGRLGTLTPEQRQAVTLRYVNRMKCVDVGREMGKSQLAVSSLLNRAVKRLQREAARGSR